MLLVFLSIFMHLIRSRERPCMVFYVVDVTTSRINLWLEIWLGLPCNPVHIQFLLHQYVFIFIVLTHIDKVYVYYIYLF